VVHFRLLRRYPLKLEKRAELAKILVIVVAVAIVFKAELHTLPLYLVSYIAIFILRLSFI
jgi:hypothetical protein